MTTRTCEWQEENNAKRIGIDVAGVLAKHFVDWQGEGPWHESENAEVLGAILALSVIVANFRPDNVFLVAYAKDSGRRGGLMAKMLHWLHRTMNVCDRTGLLQGNVAFPTPKKVQIILYSASQSTAAWRRREKTVGVAAYITLLSSLDNRLFVTAAIDNVTPIDAVAFTLHTLLAAFQYAVAGLSVTCAVLTFLNC